MNPASRSTSSSRSAKPPAWKRLDPSKRYKVGSDTSPARASLPLRLVEDESSRNRDIERLDAVVERDREGGVARAPDERSQPFPLGAEDEDASARQIRVPQARVSVGDGRIRPEIGA